MPQAADRQAISGYCASRTRFLVHTCVEPRHLNPLAPYPPLMVRFRPPWGRGRPISETGDRRALDCAVALPMSACSQKRCSVKMKSHQSRASCQCLLHRLLSARLGFVGMPALTFLILKPAAADAGFSSQCLPHGLRKVQMRRLAEGGASAQRIASISGHKSLRKIERYTDAADQKRFSRGATADSSGGRGPSWLPKVHNFRPTH